MFSNTVYDNQLLSRKEDDQDFLLGNSNWFSLRNFVPLNETRHFLVNWGLGRPPCLVSNRFTQSNYNCKKLWIGLVSLLSCAVGFGFHWIIDKNTQFWMNRLFCLIQHSWFAQLSHLWAPLLIWIFIKPFETFRRCSDDFMSKAQISIDCLFILLSNVCKPRNYTRFDEKQLKLHQFWFPTPVHFVTIQIQKYPSNESGSWLYFVNVSMETFVLMCSKNKSHIVQLS